MPPRHAARLSGADRAGLAGYSSSPPGGDDGTLEDATRRRSRQLCHAAVSLL